MASTEPRFTPERGSKIVGFLFIVGVGVPAAIATSIITIILAWQGVLIVLGKSTIPSFKGTFFIQWLPIIFLGLISLAIPLLAVGFIIQASQTRHRGDHEDKSSSERDNKSSREGTREEAIGSSYDITVDASYRELPPGRRY